MIKSTPNTFATRNATEALVTGLSSVLHFGEELTVRGNTTKEIRHQLISIDKPTERCYILPKRNNNIFAQIYETMWVLAGKDDLKSLSKYLPRAYDFSDDGQTWRAAYGPRLRSWHGIDNNGEQCFVDQIHGVLRTFQKDEYTRRAVIQIFDPAKDYVVSKDIPCNNWIHFLKRDGKLHMEVVVRSQDVIWGFSGINTYEWSVLQELMAHWLGIEVGEYHHFVSSFHIYDRHYQRAEDIVSNFNWDNKDGNTIYHYGIKSPKISTDWSVFDQRINMWLYLAALYEKGHYENRLDHDDEYFQTSIEMMKIYWMIQNGEDTSLIVDVVNAMPLCDFKVAAVEYLVRAKKFAIPLTVTQFDIPDEIQRFLSRF